MSSKKKGFTLIELLVAMGIIAVLVTLSIVAIGIVQRSLRNTQRRDVLSTVSKYIYSYFERTQEYPTTSDITFSSSADIVYFDEGGTSEEEITSLSGATSPATTTSSSGTEYCYSSNGGAFILKSGLEPSGESVLEDDSTNSVDCTLP